MLEEDPSLREEVVQELVRLEKAADDLELRTLLNGPLDENGAILSVHARDGGLDANDWAEMVMNKTCTSPGRNQQGYSVELLDRSDNEEVASPKPPSPSWSNGILVSEG